MFLVRKQVYKGKILVCQLMTVHKCYKYPKANIVYHYTNYIQTWGINFQNTKSKNEPKADNKVTQQLNQGTEVLGRS